MRFSSSSVGVPSSPAATPPPPPWFNRTVLGAGFTSSLGDFCYETTTVILPGFMAVLGVPAAWLGIIEGVADAVASFTRMVTGFLADKFGHRKLLVILGYALTPLGQAGIALAGGWPLILTGRFVSWFGKGLRGPLRDAIVAQAVTPATRGRAFGFHRAMDTVGAVIGPLLGVALLGWAQGRGWADATGPFRLVLWLSVVPGVLAVMAFLLMVKDPEHSPNPALKFFAGLKGLPAPFKRYLGAVALFGAGDFSHSLLILGATQLLTASLGVVQAAQVAGLLYVGRNIVQVLASFPVGVLADRFGAGRVLRFGYGLGALTALLMAAAFVLPGAQLAWLVVIFLLAGLYMAVQEALEPAVTADHVEEGSRGLAFGALGSVNGATKFVSSASVGLLWTAVSPAFGFGLAAILMTAGTVVLTRLRDK
jgi:MFS family permease